MSINLVEHTNDEVKDFTRMVYEKTLDKNITHVLACARGGLVLATYIAYYLDVPMMITNYSSPAGKAQHPTKDPLIQLLVDSDNPANEESSILIVDDIADSGHTLNYLRLFLVEIGHVPIENMTTCAMDYREGAIEPDLYGWKVNKNEDIIYPWIFDLNDEDTNEED